METNKIDASILKFIKKENELILETGRPHWEGAPRTSTEARVAKELRFDIKIIDQLIEEARTRKQSPNLLYHLLTSYFLVRLNHIEYAENSLEGLLHVLSKYMEKEMNNVFQLK
ncbi:MAG: hypothetical protein KAR20_13780 [Candidatus Heimdallarchaeota archaeon]|nr:hypothetical protein [Candidatus Heimdallarchaeota archaeon]